MYRLWPDSVGKIADISFEFDLIPIDRAGLDFEPNHSVIVPEIMMKTTIIHQSCIRYDDVNCLTTKIIYSLFMHMIR